jgi:hypothetical protein
MTAILLLLACTPKEAPSEQATHLVPLSAPLLLRRLSLDLRGVLPSTEQLDAVESDPSLLQTYEEQYLTDPRLEDRLVALLGERWHTRVDAFDIHHYDYGLSEDQEFVFEKSVGEEPLRLMAHVAVTDAPWTEIVTADYTMANELLASLWPLEYPEGGSGWRESRYTDGRPAVGVLATNGLWWRYVTSTFNLSRSRVAAASLLLTCYDILQRPISFSATPALADADGTATAIRDQAECVACHATIEPAASAMFGFVPMVSQNVDEVERYHPEREPLGEPTLGVESAWYGTPLDSLAEMGPAIAADPRFNTCAVETFASALWRRPTGPADAERLEALRLAFIDGDLRVRPLLRAILAGDTWRAGGVDAEADAETVARERTRRMLAPDQLDTMLEDLTGFHWEQQGFEQLANDESGYRVLFGGVNGVNVLRPQQEPGLTWAIGVQRLAEAAASSAVDHDLGGSEPRLLTVAPEAVPGDAAFDAQVRALSWRLYALRASEVDVKQWGDLWTAVAAQDGAPSAWKALLAVMFRDPAFVSE